MGIGKNWTKQEEEYLTENWGTLSVARIAKNLGRTENAIIVRKCRLGLCAFLDNGEYVTWNQFQIAYCGSSSSGTYRMTSWVKNRNFPIHTKRVNKNSFKIVYLEEWWEWAEKNKDFLDFSNMEENILGKEPEWVKEKRKNDIENKRKIINTPWTNAEDDKLRFLVSKHKYTYDDLSRMLRRTNGAIQRRLCDLGIKDRPLKADNHIRWTRDELYTLGEMIKDGCGYEMISESIGKSGKAIRGRVYNMYLTENLDKVREIIGSGNFGDNRPDRKIKQWNTMNTEERIQVRDLMIRLTAILKHEFKLQIDDTEWGEFFQKDTCQNFCSDCLKTAGCDECLNYKKVEPQNCKMCGKTFWEKKDNLYCSVCRDMRKKQWLRKRFVLEKR